MAALDFPSSPTNGQQYSAPNGAVYTWDGAAWKVSGVLSTGSAAGGDLAGTYPNPTVTPAAKSKWATVGATITPVDNSKTVLCAPTVESLQWGLASNPPARLGAYTDECRLSLNRKGDGTPDDTAKPAWFLGLSGSVATDRFRVARAPIGSSSAIDVLTLDNAGTLRLPAAGAAFTAGSLTAKARWMTHPTAGWAMLSANLNITTPPAYVQDDAAKPSWNLRLDHTSDNCVIGRSPVGTATPANLLILDNAGSLTISGPTGMKSTGTTWSNPSDPRIKRDVAPYTPGLPAILALRPISFCYNGKGGTTDDGTPCYGYDASAVRDVLPECVGTRRGKLDAADAEETDILTLDTSTFTLALINAVHELAARVAALEGAA